MKCFEKYLKYCKRKHGALIDPLQKHCNMFCSTSSNLANICKKNGFDYGSCATSIVEVSNSLLKYFARLHMGSMNLTKAGTKMVDYFKDQKRKRDTRNTKSMNENS